MRRTYRVRMQSDVGIASNERGHQASRSGMSEFDRNEYGKVAKGYPDVLIRERDHDFVLCI